MLTTYSFYLLAFISVFCGLMVVFSKKPVYSVLYLIATFFSIAGHYLLLNAQFLAAVHVIVYAGAIMVLFLFVIMFLNLNKESEAHKSVWVKFAATIAAGMMLVVLIGVLKETESISAANEFNNSIGLVKNIGQVLFGEFMLPFEISSILFLSAMVGAVMLGKKNLSSE